MVAGALALLSVGMAAVAAKAAPDQKAGYIRRIGPALSGTLYDHLGKESLEKRMNVVRRDMVQLAKMLKAEKNPAVRKQLAASFLEDKLEYQELKKRLKMGSPPKCGGSGGEKGGKAEAPK